MIVVLFSLEKNQLFMENPKLGFIFRFPFFLQQYIKCLSKFLHKKFCFTIYLNRLHRNDTQWSVIGP